MFRLSKEIERDGDIWQTTCRIIYARKDSAYNEKLIFDYHQQNGDLQVAIYGDDGQGGPQVTSYCGLQRPS